MTKKRTPLHLAVAVSILTLASCQGRMILHETESASRTTHASGRQAQVMHSTNATVWFVKMVNGEPQLVPVQRKLQGNKIETAVKELLTGPDEGELQQGYGSEIPLGTILLSVNNNADSVDLNLSRRFATGGGATSLETRLAQLSRTVKEAEPHKNVYLEVEGKRLAMIGGEGIEVKQPINK